MTSCEQEEGELPSSSLSRLFTQRALFFSKRLGFDSATFQSCRRGLAAIEPQIFTILQSTKDSVEQQRVSTKIRQQIFIKGNPP